MQTNSPRQQQVRHMTRAEKAAHSAARLAEISRLQDAAIETHRRQTAEIAELRANGASETAIWQRINSWYDTDPRSAAERAADAEWTAQQQHAADVRAEL